MEKERKDKKRAEDEVAKLKMEFSKLKSYSDQVETQKQKEKAELDNLINAYSVQKTRLETLEQKSAECENTNKLLDQMVKEKDAKIGELHRTKEELKKKYISLKTRLKAHIETEGKLEKENSNMLQKLKNAGTESGNAVSYTHLTLPTILRV